ncbi:MAG: Eco57I restriction-modification methylase domain-containing protein [Methanothrix sp.]
MIQKSAEWEDESGLALAYRRIRDKFFEKEKNLPRYVEADLEHNWIRPVLDALGHHYGVQESLHHDPLKPDYAFFPHAQALDEAYAHKGAEDFYKRSVAVGDAKAWNIALDKSQQGRALREMTNPSFQIDNYLRATPPKWAILTNGRLWRLYHEDSSFTMDSYYEVNLPHMIAWIEKTGDLSVFKYFYLFFRREAFPELPLGSSFLDRIREESLAYAQKVGEDLQENVYRAMKVLAEGFVLEPSNWPSNSYSKSSSKSSSNSLLFLADPVEREQVAKEVQDNSMRLLYRLLFIFYAESRKLLAVDNRNYRDMSLRRLKEEIADRKDRGERILAVQSTYWESLRDLFRLINDGSEAFGYFKEEFYIPPYNGGLFDPAKNPFLAEKKIGNSYLAEAIDLLARSPGEDGRPAFVDYSSLDIRHLGSIYEGILEYKLIIATEPMVAVKGKGARKGKGKGGKEVWLPKREAGGMKVSESVEAGGLYLVTDRGERKATGSFYTPQYIVKYIVKNTLAPLIDPLMEEASMDADLRSDLLRKLLSIKVLDPAMGSGHFLVEATDYIAREIIHAREIARQEEEDSDAIAENDIHWARREVVRNCIYGVDLNPMAVELAKLSLWLKTVASNKPLSFLDHHLRCGNSLIGAELENLSVLPGAKAQEPPLWSFGLKSHTESLLKRYRLMSALPDDSLPMVKWKEEQFRQIKESELSRRLAELANIWLSTYFGNKVKEEDYYELQGHLSPEKFPDWAGLRGQEWFVQAQEIAEEKRFFHWELEFPEAFAGEERGFDVVIGNPPYDELSEVALGRKIEEKQYLSETIIYKESVMFRVNLFRLFIATAIDKTKNDGFHGFIVPMALLGDRFSFELRHKMLTHTSFIFIEAFPQKDDPKDRVFFDAKLSTCVYILRRKLPKEEFRVRTHPGKNLIRSSPSYQVASIDIAKFDPNNFSIPTVGKFSWRLASRLCNDPTLCLFQDIASSSPGEIMINKQFERYLSDEPPGEIILRGANIGRYEFYEVPKQGSPVYLDKEKYLEERGNNKDSKAFDHLNHRIGYQRGSAIDNYRRVIATMLDPGVFCSDTVAYFSAANYNLFTTLALLNSKIVDWRFGLTSTTNHVNSYELDVIPIPKFCFTTPAPERARLVAELQQLYSEGKHDEILAAVESLLPKDEASNFIVEQEKSDVVHDLLAFLAERMLEMNKQKQKEVRGFLDWLEGYLGAKIEDLKPKTKILSYYESDYESLLAVLKKNKKKLAVDPSRREPGEALRAEFEGSMSKLGPLRERIKETDELIDAVVYRLYGLTDEEIEIVEGKA